jgi:signal transduction histidine kinase
MAARTNEVRSAMQQLAGALLDDVERIAARSVTRTRELLPSYANLPPEALIPVTLTNTRNVLEAVLDADADPSRAEDHFRVSGETRIREGITADDILQAWRIGVESVREEAHAVAGRLGIGDDVLLEFVEMTLQWGDVGMRISAKAHRDLEIHELERLAAEQAALQRVATLVAQGGQPSEVFDTVAAELAGLLQADHVMVCRYEPGSELTVLAHHGSSSREVPPGTRINHEGDSVEAVVWRTERSARLEGYEGARGRIAEHARAAGVEVAFGAPVVVDCRLWGVASAGWNWGQPPPVDTEERMAKFADLVATAIANAEARAEVERLAEEQAALRRVATLVAEGAPATAVFDAVAAEIERVLGADGVSVSRYEPDDEVTVVAHSGADPPTAPPGTRVSIADVVRNMRGSASVWAPIVVEGLWGVAIAKWRDDEPPPADTEERMAKFAELLDTAIANADSRDQLAASRARLLTEADEARRRVVRDLHDGAQERLVHTIVTLKLAQQALRENDPKAESLIAEALEQAQQGSTDLRELAHGILPAVLTEGGLRAGVRSVVARLDLSVEVDIPAQRFPAEIEASAYFIVAEALTNVVKHAHARRAKVTATVEDGELSVEVRDDGIGGADPEGHGLVGLGDRVTALGGRLQVESPSGGGTVLVAALPLPLS